MDGIINIYKEKNMTSHDVVNIMRNIFKTKKVGHTGTLDPIATGVLPICIGSATRISQYLTEKNKTYIAKVSFGYETDTQDISGKKIGKFNLPNLSERLFNEICQSFRGPQIQIPPIYSAVKYRGKPLYKYAREGIKILDLPRRNITVFSIKLISFTKENAELEIECSKGTYIRTLCADIARKAGTGGYLSELERIKSGEFELSDTVSIEKIKKEPHPEKFIYPLTFALKSYPQINLNDSELIKVRNGMKINTGSLDSHITIAIYKKRLISIGEIQNNYFYPRKVFSNYAEDCTL